MIAIRTVNSYLVFLLALSMVACKKEAVPQPSNKEEFYLTVKDNPSDPVDHAIYEFYKTTGIPLYYNDTVAREQVGDSAGIPRYSYQRLAVRYSPVGSQVNINFVLLTEKELVLPMLPFLKDSLLPRIPEIFPAKPAGGAKLIAKGNGWIITQKEQTFCRIQYAYAECC